MFGILSISRPFYIKLIVYQVHDVPSLITDTDPKSAVMDPKQYVKNVTSFVTYQLNIQIVDYG